MLPAIPGLPLNRSWASTTPRYLVPIDPKRCGHYFADVLIIGGGLAGLRAAHEVDPSLRTMILTKDKLEESNSSYAQGGIASVWDPEDRFDNHVQDTLVAGGDLCDLSVVEMVVREAPDRVSELIQWGTHFDQNAGQLTLGREGGHSHQRIIHALGDATGKEIMRAGDWLAVGERLVSRTGNKVAIMQDDGNFVVYPANNGAQASATTSVFSFLLLSNGNDVKAGVAAAGKRAFVTMQGDGRLCAYKGNGPSNNLGFLYCVTPQAAANNYFLRLQTDGNLVVNQGTSLFDAGYYVFDFITRRPGTPSFWDKAANGIKSAVGCS